MNKLAKIAALSLLVLFVCAAPALAEDGGGTADASQSFSINLSKYFGVGLTVIGAALGISKLASAALEGMARQPEVAGNIQTAMIIAAALIEGFTFFALVICMLGS